MFSNRKGMVRPLTAAALGATVLTGLPGAAMADTRSAAVDARPAASSTPKAYVGWLNAKAGSGDAGAAKLAEKFQALSTEKQEKYLGYINNPSYFDAFINAVDGAAESRTEMANGDVVVERSRDQSPTNQPGETAALGTMWATHSVKVKYLGLEATKVVIKTSYAVRGTDTTKVYPGSAWFTNYIAGTDLSHGVVDEWISPEPADNAHSETVWKFEWWTGIEDTGRHRVWADYSGYKGGYLKT